ncbi:MAG: hypothetical protein FJZ92_02190 [Chloroflexi bacterium]|nr:hypothetical protein [Chloroflexota bacterium]
MPESLRIWRVYTGDDAQTHVEPLEVPLGEPRRGGAISELFAGGGVLFRRTGLDYDLEWHPAPRRQLVVTLSGRGEIETSDGTVLPLEPGTIVLVEDVDGIGHRSRAVGEEPRVSLFLPLDPGTRFA